MVKKFVDFIFESSNIELHYYCFDIDDNILHMPTKILMDKKVGGKWLPISVSTAKFAEVRNDKENWRLRNNNPTEAFSEFRDTGLRGKNAFLEDLKTAILNKSMAPSWETFIKCLSEGAIFALITARGHEPDTLRRGVEYIIDEVLTKMPSLNPGMSLADDMFQNLRKYEYIFELGKSHDQMQLKGQPSQNVLVMSYLDHCGFYGVSSDSFAKEFGQASAQNPEVAKEIALNKFIEKSNEFGQSVGAKTVSVGFSDDDPKNVEHVYKFFKEKSQLLGTGVKLSLYKTTDPTVKGGEVIKFTETSHQAVGVESSILPHIIGMTQQLYPSTKDALNDDYHNQIKTRTKKAIDLYRGGKKFAFKKKIKKYETSKNF